MGRLDGKVAIVTGGASGIGEATVRLLRSQGARVLAADVQDERGKRLAEELGEDVARAALWLTSDDTSFVNGQAIVVDGGLSAGRPWSQTPEPMRRYEPMAPPGQYWSARRS